MKRKESTKILPNHFTTETHLAKNFDNKKVF